VRVSFQLKGSTVRRTAAQYVGTGPTSFKSFQLFLYIRYVCQSAQSEDRKTRSDRGISIRLRRVFFCWL